jgi:hypothetical protein
MAFLELTLKRKEYKKKREETKRRIERMNKKKNKNKLIEGGGGIPTPKKNMKTTLELIKINHIYVNIHTTIITQQLTHTQTAYRRWWWYTSFWRRHSISLTSKAEWRRRYTSTFTFG